MVGVEAEGGGLSFAQGEGGGAFGGVGEAEQFGESEGAVVGLDVAQDAARAGSDQRVAARPRQHGVDPGLQKDGVEKHLQVLLAEHPESISPGLTLVRREYPTAIGPVDLMCRDESGVSVAVEIKRRGEIDGVEQLTRYLELLNRDTLLTSKGPVRGIFAAQEIKPQARVLAEDRVVSYGPPASHHLRWLASANCLLEIPEDVTQIEAGTAVQVWDLST